MNLPEPALECLRSDEAIVAVYLFGSRADDVHRHDSDWDLAVLWTSTVAATDRFRRRMRLIEALTQLVGVRVDVVDLRSAPILLAAGAVRGQLLLDRDATGRSVFEMGIRSREDDARIAHRWAHEAGRLRAKARQSTKSVPP